MTSRRQFFQASSLALTTLASSQVSANARGLEDLKSKPGIPRDLWNDLPNYMSGKVNAARATRKAELAALKTQAGADERIAFIQSKVWELIGGKLDQTPLNPKVTGVIDRSTYRIEKVIFESQPEFYVTAHLYIPKKGRDRYPGILAPVGHAPEGKTFSSYQTLFQNLARMGFAVLAWEPPGQGERLQYLDATLENSIYGPTGEHDRFGVPALLIGSTTTQFETWDGVRALDYLLSRPEIDAERIGLCGHSGGGTQTMFLCAAEPRVKVAVSVEGHTENLAGANYQAPGAYADAEQNLINGLKLPLDRGDLLAAFTPKPLLICYTPVDTGTTYSPTYVEGTKEIFEELKDIYGLYGAKERVGLFASTLPHDYDYFHRRATYEWFNKWLMPGQESTEESAFEDAPEHELWCTPTGQVLTSIGGRAAYQVNYDRLRTAKLNLSNTSVDKTQIRKDLRDVLNLPSRSSDLHAQPLSTNRHQNVVVEEFQFESEPGVRVPGWFVKPASGPSRFPVVLMLEEHGRNGLFDQWALIEQCARSGMAICSVDLRGSGDMRPRLPATGPAFYGFDLEFAYSMVNLSIGSPLLGQQTWDLLRCLDYLVSRDDADAHRIVMYGSGLSGLPCVAVAALDDRVRSLMLNRTLADFESIVGSKEYKLPLSAVAFGILKKFDLPDLCASVTPRPVWIFNSTGPTGNSLTESEIREKYKSKQGQELVLRIDRRPTEAVISEWTSKALV